jgi:hypothetical protein
VSLPDTLSPVQVGVLILELGGPVDKEKIATAIGVCTGESGRRASNSNSQGNSPPSTDRGAWMFNSYWQEDVSDHCAYDWECSTREMLKLSRNLTDWSPWYAWHPNVGDPYRSSATKAIKIHHEGRSAQVLGSSVASAGGPGRGGGTPSWSTADGLITEEQRSGLLKALVWVVLVLGGAALVGLGFTRAAGAGGTT